MNLRSAMAFLTVLPVARSEGAPGERLGGGSSVRRCFCVPGCVHHAPPRGGGGDGDVGLVDGRAAPRWAGGLSGRVVRGRRRGAEARGDARPEARVVWNR